MPGLGGLEQRLVEGLELVAHPLEALHHLEALGHALAVAPYHGLGGIELQALLLDQVVDHLDGLDVFGRVEPYVFGAACGLDDGELLLPVAQRRGGNAEYLGHIAYAVETFGQFFHATF